MLVLGVYANILLMDRINSNILQILRQDGRISNTDLAAQVGLSVSACLRRVQELERRGVIQGYRAVIDREKLDEGFIVYVAVALSDHTRSSLDAFEKGIRAARQVKECHQITGAVEYLLRVEVADLPAYKRFHTDVLGALPQVRGITSYIVMDSAKDERA